MARKRQFNELSHCKIAVWCELSPGIDPAQWASLCRSLARLSPATFRSLAQRFSKKNLLTSPRNFLDSSPAETADPLPLVSLGPSGVGGEFQTEFRQGFVRRGHRDR